MDEQRGRDTVEDGAVRRNVFINQAGYLPHSAKTLVVEGLQPDASDVFLVADVNVQEEPWHAVYEGKLRRVAGDFGTYHVGDFSQVTEPGEYILVIRTAGKANFFSYPFPIAEDVFDDVLEKGVYFHSVQRCGPSSTGYNTPCHMDDAIREETGEYINLVGGWHNSSDLLKWSHPSLMSMLGLLSTAIHADPLTREGAILRARIYEETRWGNLYFHKLQDPKGHVCSHGVGGDLAEEGDHWTDNIKGTPDDRKAVTRIADPGEQHAFIWAQALFAGTYAGLDPDYAGLCLDRAQRCFAWVSSAAAKAHDYAEEFERRGQSAYYASGSGVGAATEMFRVTQDERYLRYAEEMAEGMMALQERDWIGGQQEVRGFFYADTHGGDGIRVGIVESLPLLALCRFVEALPDHPLAARCSDCIEMHCRDFVQVMSAKNAFGIVPRGIALPEPTEPHVYGTGGVPRLRKIGDLGYVYFATVSRGARNCARAGLAAALFKAARIFDRPEWAAIAQRSLDWILGSNPFGVSFVVDVGRVNPPEYIYAGFQPRTPRIPGAGLQGPAGDRYDRPDLLPGEYASTEYWTLHTSFLMWGMAEAKAYWQTNPEILTPVSVPSHP